MVCEGVYIINSGLLDLPNVVVDDETSIQICGSSRWKKMQDLPGVFVSVLSHESIHQVLGRMDQEATEALDNVGSLSVISRSLNDVGLCAKYPHGLIGIDGFQKKGSGRR
jgi:hypothetical protein